VPDRCESSARPAPRGAGAGEEGRGCRRAAEGAAVARALAAVAVLGLALPSIAAGSSAAAGRQAGGDEAPPSPDETRTPASGDEPEIAPQLVSPYQTRIYRIKPKKLWKALLEHLETAGYPPEEIDEATRTVKTSFVDFDQDDYSEQVTDPPPYLSPKYPILQMVRVREGKVSLEGVVEKEKGGAALRLRARILVQGLDRRQGIRVLTDRRSSGVIETEFLRRLEDGLGLVRVIEGG
jgi:hypothetical protein